MSVSYAPCEGSIFILSYTECDYETEDTAALVFILNNGRLRPLLGVMDLPDGANFNRYDSNNYGQALKIVLDHKITHVFTPQFNVQEVDFYGQKLGFSALSDELNDRGEIECWFEIGSFVDWTFIRTVEEQQLKVIEINPETKEIIT